MTHPDHADDDALGQRLHQAIQALPDVPPALQRAAIALWPAGASGLKAVMQHIAAVLSFDSWAAPAMAAGMRSLRSPTRQLLFSAQGRDVDLRIAPVGPTWSITGQVLGPDDSGWVELVRVQQGSGQVQTDVLTAALDSLGEFRLEALERGSYALSLHLGDDTLVLPPVAVGEQPA